MAVLLHYMIPLIYSLPENRNVDCVRMDEKREGFINVSGHERKL